MILTPAPGIVIATTPKDTESIALTNRNSTRLLKGTVVAVGPVMLTDAGALIEPPHYANVGDTIYFLSYEGDYDNAEIDHQKYYMIKVQDIRARI